jgi:hypothetical protein
MELDDFKNAWDGMSDRAKENQNVNLKIAGEMSKKKYQSRLMKILLPEILGSLVSVGAAGFVGINFFKLEKASSQIAGIIAILLLLILPAISLKSIQQLYRGGNTGQSYADTLKEFAAQKIKFCKLQKLNLRLSYLLLVVVILLLPELFGKNEITGSKYFFVFAFTFGYSFLLVFSKWVFKNYNRIIRQTEDLLKELSV